MGTLKSTCGLPMPLPICQIISVYRVILLCPSPVVVFSPSAVSTCKVVLVAPVGMIISGSLTVYKVSSLSLPLCSFSLSSVLGSFGMSPKVLWKWLVAAMNWKSTCSVFCVVKSFLRLIAALLSLFQSTCLAGWCAVQCKSRCSTVSSFCWNAGHVGELVFLMQCRCLASGTCPIFSYVRMLACFLGRFVMSLRYLSGAAVGSVFFSSK